MKIFPVFLFLLLLTGAANAQTENSETEIAWEADIEKPLVEPRLYPVFIGNWSFQGGIPLAAFGNNLDKVGIGTGATLLVNMAQSPIFAGVEGSILFYEKELLEANIYVDNSFKECELKTNTNIALLHAIVRIQPPRRRLITPYADVMVGYKYLFAHTTITDKSVNKLIENRKDQSDWAFSYGGALGIQINLSATDIVVLDLRYTYLRGNRTTYLVHRKEANTNYNDSINAFEKKSSLTDILMPQIGLTFRLRDKEGFRTGQ